LKVPRARRKTAPPPTSRKAQVQVVPQDPTSAEHSSNRSSRRRTRLVGSSEAAISPAEEQLAHLAAIVDWSEDAIISKDLHGTITSWNRGAERIFGYSASEVVGKPGTILIPQDLHDEEPATLARIRAGDRIEHYETIRRRKDGVLIDVSLGVSPIIDRDGTIVGASKIARDVTVQKQLAAQEQEATSRLYEIGRLCIRSGPHHEENLSNILNAAMWMGRASKGTIQLFDEGSNAFRLFVHHGFGTQSLEYLTSVSRDDLVGSGVLPQPGERIVIEDITTSDLSAVWPGLKKLLDARVRALHSTPLISSRWTVLGMITIYFDAPHRPSEREARWLDVLARQAADYVERKQIEEQREQLLHAAEQARHEAEAANRAKDQFLATLSHELRSPLSAVLTWLQLLRSGFLDSAKAANALEVIDRNTRLQVKLIEDLVDVSRISAGKLTIDMVEVDVRSVVAAAVENIRAVAANRMIVLTSKLSERPLHVSGDPIRLQQVFNNLLSNAIKFSSPGGGVDVEMRQDGREAVVLVRDTGKGIAAQDLEKIFDRFAQVDSTITRRHQGLGLGLTIAQHVVSLHSGRIEAHSEGENQGSIFTVRLPLVDLASIGPAASKSKMFVRNMLDGICVLIVDDDWDNLDASSGILAAAGARVTKAASVPEALARFEEVTPDVVVTDLAMPDRDGFALVHAIRQGEQTHDRKTPIVCLTALSDLDAHARARMDSFDRHLVKPVSPLELVEAVTSCVHPAPGRS
jgi:PAS domain S-box-containing protein